MISKSSLLITLVIVALSVFSFGYWLGTENTLSQLKLAKEDLSDSNVSPFLNSDLDSVKYRFGDRNELSGDVVIDKKETRTELSNQAAPIENTNHFELSESASVLDIMAFLLERGASKNVNDVRQLALALDKLKIIVSQDPNNMQILVDYFVDSNAAAQAPYYITTVLQGADFPDKDIVINNMIGRLSMQGTANANEKLLHLIASTGAHRDNEQVTDTLKNIALYAQANDSNRNYALDLLMPYQLNKNEKSKVVSNLTLALSQTPDEEVSYIIENIIKYSDSPDRVKLATNYLAESNSFSTRVAILSTMHNGSVKPNDTLKAKLFEIAQNPSDPLNKHAKDTLMYVFEIDNNEYKRLRTGG